MTAICTVAIGMWTPAVASPTPAPTSSSTSTKPLTEAFLDIEANFDGEEISSVPGLNPAQFAGTQFQTSNVDLHGGSTTTPADFYLLGSNPNDYYQVDVTGPGGTGITTGVYTVSPKYYPFSFAIEDSSCNPGDEWIDVLEATYTANQLTSFAAMFEYHCDSLQNPGAPTPAIFGDISFNATEPFYAADLSSDVLEAASTGVTPSSVSATITNTGLTTLNPHGFSIDGTDPEDFTIGANSCESALSPGSSCSIVIEYAPPTSDASDDAVLQFYDELTPTLTGGSGVAVPRDGSPARISTLGARARQPGRIVERTPLKHQFPRHLAMTDMGLPRVSLTSLLPGWSWQKGWSHAQAVPCRVQAGRGGRRPAAHGAARRGGSRFRHLAVDPAALDAAGRHR